MSPHDFNFVLEAEQKKREANIARDAVSVIKNLTIIRRFSTILFYFQARRKQREEELYDEKAEQASKHAETLRRNRESCLERIAGRKQELHILLHEPLCMISSRNTSINC